jgi:hypothetical protein
MQHEIGAEGSINESMSYVLIDGQVFQVTTVPGHLSAFRDEEPDEAPRPEIVVPDLSWWDAPSLN